MVTNSLRLISVGINAENGILKARAEVESRACGIVLHDGWTEATRCSHVGCRLLCACVCVCVGVYGVWVGVEMCCVFQRTNKRLASLGALIGVIVTTYMAYFFNTNFHLFNSHLLKKKNGQTKPIKHQKFQCQSSTIEGEIPFKWPNMLITHLTA